MNVTQSYNPVKIRERLDNGVLTDAEEVSAFIGGVQEYDPIFPDSDAARVFLNGIRNELRTADEDPLRGRRFVIVPSSHV